ncbi:hypothetical protein [Luteimicrobium subarcticum]|uniref:hypothetical protein n=1 Tax=Luteimicrobium subarcticum TaxID=620910 RepID=UPI0012FE25D4|nr:hypothetical protein [Luteimicrobium subarcticum]
MIRTDYGQFDLTWSDDGGFDGDWDRFFAGQANGLVGAADPDGVYINIARRSGGSPVRIVLLDTPPGDPDASWDDVVEVSTVVPVGVDVRWQTWAGEDWGRLEAIVPGQYRVRVNARGRDAGSDGEFAAGAVDWYLIELWSAPPAPDVIVRTGSDNAAYWHGEVGDRAVTR